MTGAPAPAASPVPRRRLGRSSLAVSEIGLGCAPLGELVVRVSDDQAHATLAAAWQEGVRYFDCAPEYGWGLAEQRAGRFLRACPRDQLVLSTKVGRILSAPRDLASFRRDPWIGGLDFVYRFDYGYDGIMRSVEDSIQRLGMNRIDAILIHDLDIFTHQTQAQVDAHLAQLQAGGWRALAELRAAGLVRAIGAGLNDRSMVMRLIEVLDLDFILLALRYTLLEHETLGLEMRRCAERGIGVVVGGIFNSGILATGAVPGARYNYEPAPPPVVARVDRIAAICRRHDVPLAAAALQFPLAHPAVASVIPGALSPDQVAANMAAYRRPIPAALWSELKAETLIDAEAPVPAPR